MKRRGFLATLTGVGLAGCSTVGRRRDTPSPRVVTVYITRPGQTRTRTRASEPTPTPSGEAKDGSAVVLTPNPWVEIESSRLQLTDPRFVIGIARNISRNVISYMEVWAYFYDEDDVRIAEWFDNTVDLPPKGRWEFNIPVDAQPSRIDEYRLQVRDVRFR